ncbi:glycolipid transfer protein 1-like isoform X2 [Malus sylvestris]|nr:glycolipid transfer protein 1-like isoform X2 [Malus sylvestris]
MERIYQSNPSKFEHLYSLVNFDVETNNSDEQCSSTVSLVWLTRYMDFLVELFRNLREHPPDWVTIRAVYNAYAKTLIKWHDEKILGRKFAPEKDLLLKVIGGNGDVMGDMEKFCTSFTPLLKQNHEFLASLGMDDLKLSGASLVAKVPSTYPKKEKMGKTMFAPALEELESVKSKSKEILTKHFLESCNKILPVIAKFGNAVYSVNYTIRLHVARLQSRYSSDPSKFNYLYGFMQFEIETFSLNILTRNMDFVVELFRNLLEHPEWFTIEACKDAYGKTLKIWFERQEWFEPNNTLSKVYSALSTDREKFMEAIEGNGDVMGDIKKFCSIFTPLIKEIDKFLASSGSDKSKLLIDGGGGFLIQLHCLPFASRYCGSSDC